MAYCRAQRIRSIVRLWYGLEIQQQLYHLLHLLFICMSVSGYGKLYLHGRVLVKGYPSLLCRQHGHAAPGANLYSCGGVMVEEQFLKHRTVRLVQPQKPAYSISSLSGKGVPTFVSTTP